MADEKNLNEIPEEVKKEIEKAERTARREKAKKYAKNFAIGIGLAAIQAAAIVGWSTVANRGKLASLAEAVNTLETRLDGIDGHPVIPFEK